MSDIKKKKFSFFDLSDDDSFNNINNKEEQVVNKEETISNTAESEIKHENIQEQNHDQQPRMVNPSSIIKQQESFYGKVEAFVPSKKEIIIEKEEKEEEKKEEEEKVTEEQTPVVHVSEPIVANHHIEKVTNNNLKK